jgi:hypothetical protein
MTRPFVLAAILALGFTAAAEAKTCKEPLTVSSRSTIAGGEEARTKRATSNAEKKWGKEAKAKHGFQYQFLMRADGKTVECRQTPKSTVCDLTATPCSLL